jgi:RNA polymerase sigma-70 factor (ECF subfamily)
MLQSRKSRREGSVGLRVPDPVVTLADPADPEQQAIMADSVGLALLVVLESLSPSERLAFVLHDMFDIPFEEIAPIIDKSPAAARQLASRARRRVRTAAVPDPDRLRQQRVADAFLAAAREGNFEGLLALLDPDVVLHIDGGTVRPGATKVVRGARAVAEGAMRFASHGAVRAPGARERRSGFRRPPPRRPDPERLGDDDQDGKIVEMDGLTDAERLAKLDLSAR